ISHRCTPRNWLLVLTTRRPGLPVQPTPCWLPAVVAFARWALRIRVVVQTMHNIGDARRDYHSRRAQQTDSVDQERYQNPVEEPTATPADAAERFICSELTTPSSSAPRTAVCANGFLTELGVTGVLARRSPDCHH